jgi:membrane protease subunit HflK
MPWNNGGPNGGPSPWGTPPGGDRPQERPNDRPSDRPDDRSGNQGPWGDGGRRPSPGGLPPDVDELLARAQGFVRGLLPPGFGGGRGTGRGGFGSGRGLALVVVALAAMWLASGFYRVQPDEQGVVLRFGAYDRTTLPGLNYHLPWPVEAVLRPAVTRINRVEIGYSSGAADARPVPGVLSGQDELRAERLRSPARDIPEESLMLTGDENIIDIDFAVFWRVREAKDYLFNTRNPDYAVKSVSESVMREVIGRTPIQPALTDARAQIEQSVKTGVQYVLDQYGAGIEVTQVQLQKVDPPAAVIDSFRDVQRANTDAERLRNEAEAYRNDVVPRARGDAAAITLQAEGQKQSAIAEATGQAQRFLSVLRAYESAKDVTLQRLYLETMEQVLAHAQPVIVDDKLRGLLPLLPLTPGGTQAPPPPAPAPAGSAAR